MNLLTVSKDKRSRHTQRLAHNGRSTMDLSEFRYPGEFEPQTDVFVTWIPDYVGEGDDEDPRVPCVEIIKNLLGHVNVHVNCGMDTSIERCQAYLAAHGIDSADADEAGARNTSEAGEGEGFSTKIHFHKFKDWGFYNRDNGPNVVIDDKGNRVNILPRWSNYGMNGKMEPAQQLGRSVGTHMAAACEIYENVPSDMVSEQGNREYNGRGVMMVVEDTDVRKRNPEYTKEQIEAEYKKLYGVEKIIWLPKPLLEDDDFRMGPMDHLEDGTPVWAGSFVGHSDEMARFVTPDTILLAEVTDEEAAETALDAENKKRLDAAYEVLKNATDIDGNPFKIIRVPVAPQIMCRIPNNHPTALGWKQFFDEIGGKAFDGTPWPEGDYCFLAAASYCNFLVCNDVVLGQRYWRPGMDESIREKDERAKAILEQVYPDRKVTMIDVYALNLTGGGVHCWTKNIPAA